MNSLRHRPAPRLVEVADAIFAYVQPDGGWCLNNCGIVVGARGATVIDTPATVPRARLLRMAIAQVSPRPVATIVNTHHHGDHTFGNHTVAPHATVVGHRATGPAMLREGLRLTSVWPETRWGAVQLAPPTRTYTHRTVLPTGGRLLHLLHPGRAHTDNDTAVWDPETRVLFTGDICMSGVTPLVVDGSVAGTLEALRNLSALRPETVVSGHGPVGGSEVLDDTTAYLLALQGWAREGLAAGITPLELARTVDLGPFTQYVNPERIVANLHRAYAEERSADPFTMIDTDSARRDVFALLGGRPPVCHA
ncbi:MBL fold metallo-hydrolase [Streptomyces goshikiensis]|uniref:MBL fold metallo-hydrolase n=1 Tax=Streptomyces goshikiensis TaxID=1942 RepID=UPI003697E6D6